MEMFGMTCDTTTDLYGVMDIINQNGKGVVFVVDEDARFVGTVTDGDLRRSVLAKCPLGIQVKEILDPDSKVFQEICKYIDNPKAIEKLQQPSVYASVSEDPKDLIELVNERIKIIPLLDEDGRVVDFFEFKTSFNVPISSPIFKGNELNYVVECIETSWISSQGRFIKEFEQKFAGFCGVKYGVAVSNGTVAIHLALESLELDKGSEIIVPDLTFAATINSVLHANLKPVIVDVDRETWCIDPLAISEAITYRTCGIIPVHIYGQPANMTEIIKIASQNNLRIVEDCAEAPGAKIDGKMVGSFGDIACFSFFGNKIITTGEGGMCVTSDRYIYERMKILRDHGMSKQKKYWHDVVGFNYRMTNMQAAVGVAQLEQIADILKTRDEIQKIYVDGFKYNPNIVFQKVRNEVAPVVWLVSCLLRDNVDRDSLISVAKEKGIDLRPFFHPLSDMGPYREYSRNFTTVTHDLSKNGICLPTSLNMTRKDLQKVINILQELLL